jgi:hypothetical protein
MVTVSSSWTHARFLHRTIVIRIFVSRKGFKLISLALKILEMSGLSRLYSFWHKKIDHKVVWSRFLPVGTHARFLYRIMVIIIFVSQKAFWSPPLKILKTLTVYRFCFVWPNKIDDKNCMFKVSFVRTHTHVLHRNVSISNFGVLKRFYIQIPHS